MLLHIPGDTLAFAFGGSRDLGAVEATVASWKSLPGKDLLPRALLEIIGQHIQRTAAAIRL
jgi:hypothetical protein